MLFTVYCNQIKENTLNRYVLEQASSEKAIESAWKFIEDSAGTAQIIRMLDGSKVESIGQLTVRLMQLIPKFGVNIFFLGTVGDGINAWPRFMLLLDGVETGIVITEAYTDKYQYIAFDHAAIKSGEPCNAKRR